MIDWAALIPVDPGVGPRSLSVVLGGERYCLYLGTERPDTNSILGVLELLDTHPNLTKFPWRLIWDDDFPKITSFSPSLQSMYLELNPDDLQSSLAAVRKHPSLESIELNTLGPIDDKDNEFFVSTVRDKFQLMYASLDCRTSLVASITRKHRVRSLYEAVAVTEHTIPLLFPKTSTTDIYLLLREVISTVECEDLLLRAASRAIEGKGTSV